MSFLGAHECYRISEGLDVGYGFSGLDLRVFRVWTLGTVFRNLDFSNGFLRDRILSTASDFKGTIRLVFRSGFWNWVSGYGFTGLANDFRFFGSGSLGLVFLLFAVDKTKMRRGQPVYNYLGRGNGMVGDKLKCR